MRPWLVLPVSIAVSVPVNPLVNTPVDAFRVGFKDLVARIAGICMGFYTVPLKTHAPVHKRFLLGLKTHAFCNKPSQPS